jgi:hypothetical protein
MLSLVIYVLSVPIGSGTGVNDSSIECNGNHTHEEVQHPLSFSFVGVGGQTLALSTSTQSLLEHLVLTNIQLLSVFPSLILSDMVSDYNNLAVLSGCNL